MAGAYAVALLHTHTHVRIHAQIYSHAYTHTYTHTHMHTDPVAIVIAPPDTVVMAGSTVILTCVAFGYPLPNSITWSRSNGQDPPYVIENSTDYVNIYSQEVEQGGAVFLQSILELCGVTEEYSGNYSCYAVSSAGNDSASFQLIVQSGMCVFLHLV